MAAEQISEKQNCLLQSPLYKTPKKGFLSLLPRSWIPYAELMRLHKPVGILIIYYPYLFGLLYAAVTREQLPSIWDVLILSAKLFLSCLILRSFGCTWNDIVDADVDKLVARCRNRPLARGAIPISNAYIFSAAQGLVWIASLYYLLRDLQQTLTFSIPLTSLVIFYPFAKRITYYVPVILGFTLAYGVYVGYACLAGNLSDLKSMDSKFYGSVLLYISYVIWTVIHDVIYAFQDYKDDLAAGLMSLAVHWQDRSKSFLIALAIVQIAIFIGFGLLTGMHAFYYVFACLNIGVLEALMLTNTDLDNPSECWHWFQYGCIGFGLLVSFGLLSEYLVLLLQL